MTDMYRSEEVAEAIVDRTGGQPYLTQLYGFWPIANVSALFRRPPRRFPATYSSRPVPRGRSAATGQAVGIVTIGNSNDGTEFVPTDGDEPREGVSYSCLAVGCTDCRDDSGRNGLRGHEIDDLAGVPSTRRSRRSSRDEQAGAVR